MLTLFRMISVCRSPFGISRLSLRHLGGCGSGKPLMTGLYLAIASLAFAIIVEDMTIHCGNWRKSWLFRAAAQLFGYEIIAY